MNKRVDRDGLTMENDFDLVEYLSNGVENLVNNAIRATLTEPKEAIFLAKYAKSSKKASLLRQKAHENGEDIPPFLIASITTLCNLHCAGCYARANHACFNSVQDDLLTAGDWGKIFKEATTLGISFILLAGGEPLLRRDVITEASKYKDILFPIFTNATMFDAEYRALFDKNRNLLPIISIEGDERETDNRRGTGVYKSVLNTVEAMNEKRLVFGISVTLTTDNMRKVTSAEFLEKLCAMGAKLVFYIEFVPVTQDLERLALNDRDREWMERELSDIRRNYDDMIFISFPGDEKASGGCLAAGRGFFHINAHGAAEPCPFSPYSDINVKQTSLRKALRSNLFECLRTQNILAREHGGGCVLFENKAAVESILKQEHGSLPSAL